MRARRTLALPALALVLALAAGCGSDDSSGDTDSARAAGDTATTGDCTWTFDGQEPAKKVDPPAEDAEAAAKAVITTNFGDVTITFDDKTPCTDISFASLAQQGYYDDSPCHRISTPESGYGIVQCGDPTGQGTGGPGYTIPDELTGEETYAEGTIAMANTGAPNSGGGQFFLNYADSGFPPSYTQFGTIDEAGVKVLQKATEAGVEGGGVDGPPAEKIVIESVTLE